MWVPLHGAAVVSCLRPRAVAAAAFGAAERAGRDTGKTKHGQDAGDGCSGEVSPKVSTLSTSTGTRARARTQTRSRVSTLPPARGGAGSTLCKRWQQQRDKQFEDRPWSCAPHSAEGASARGHAPHGRGSAARVHSTAREQRMSSP